MNASERDDIRSGERRTSGELPLAVENPAIPDTETVSEFGETEAKRAAMAAEPGRDEESGSVAEQHAYLAREARITEEEREERAREADIHNAPHDQHRND